MAKDKEVAAAGDADNVPAKVESTLAIAQVDAADLREMMASNLEGAELNTFDLPRLKVPSGDVPGFSYKAGGDEDVMKEVTGVIIYKQSCRSYWVEGLDAGGGGSPPDCTSPDGKNGKGDPGGVCAACAMNEFGSDPKGSRGKACKEQRAVFILIDGDFLPTLLMLPPTSVGALGQYMLALMNKLCAFWHVKTTLKLVNAQNKDGVAFKQVEFVNDGRMSDSDIALTKAYRADMVPALEAAEVVEKATSEKPTGGLS